MKKLTAVLASAAVCVALLTGCFGGNEVEEEIDFDVDFGVEDVISGDVDVLENDFDIDVNGEEDEVEGEEDEEA